MADVTSIYGNPIKDAVARADIATNTQDISDLKDGLSDMDDRVTALEGGGSGSGLTAEIKVALLQIASKVAYIDDDGQDYYDDLYDALYPSAEVVSISAVYTQSGTVYDTDTLESLRVDLVVTANMSDHTTRTVTTYTLSGTLTAGTSTITVSYGGKTTTFTVTVTAAPTLSSISAVYTQSGTVYSNDSLDSLKSDLVVTATYTDQTTETITNYTLSGTLEVGTSTITVTYGGKTDTFDVTVSDAPAQPLYNWDLSSSLTDSINSSVATTNATFTQGTGVVFTNINSYVDYGEVYGRNRTYELDVALGSTSSNAHRRLLAFATSTNTSQGGAALVYRHSYGWRFYTGTAWDATELTGTEGERIFDGKTVKLYLDSDGYAHVSYKTIGADDSTYVLLGTSTSTLKDFSTGTHVYNGSSMNDSVASATITGLRIYQGEK